jgi:hypothetical protein
MGALLFAHHPEVSKRLLLVSPVVVVYFAVMYVGFAPQISSLPPVARKFWKRRDAQGAREKTSAGFSA